MGRGRSALLPGRGSALGKGSGEETRLQGGSCPSGPSGGLGGGWLCCAPLSLILPSRGLFQVTVTVGSRDRCPLWKGLSKAGLASKIPTVPPTPLQKEPPMIPSPGKRRLPAGQAKSWVALLGTHLRVQPGLPRRRRRLGGRDSSTRPPLPLLGSPATGLEVGSGPPKSRSHRGQRVPSRYRSRAIRARRRGAPARSAAPRSAAEAQKSGLAARRGPRGPEKSTRRGSWEETEAVTGREGSSPGVSGPA